MIASERLGDNPSRIVACFMLSCAFFCVCGCGGRTYTGEFRVTNRSSREVTVKRIEGFGRSEPVVGVLIPGANKASVMPELRELPVESTIVWAIEGSDEIMRQTLNLSAIPRGPGVIGFEFTADSEWVVTFAPKR